MTAEPGYEQGVVVSRQGVDDKIFIRGVVVGARCAVKQPAYARQDITQEREGFGTILRISSVRFAFFRRGNYLPAVMFANLERVFFRGETVELVAIG